MSTALVKPPDAAAIEKVLLQGDLSSLSAEQRITYYLQLCESLDLNPLTKPFEYLEFKGPGGKMSLMLYTRKDCTDQIRNKRNASSKIVSREVVDGVYVVTARATTPSGREEESIGAVPLVKEGGRWATRDGRREFESDGTFVPLRPEERANAMMKAETKAKRRATLSLFGLGMIDESEIETIKGARTVTVEEATSGKLLEDGAASNPKPAATVERPIPEELKIVIEKLRAGDDSVIAPACKATEDEMITLGLEQRYADRKTGLRTSFPGKTPIPRGVMESFLLDCWDEIEKAKAARAEPKPEGDKSDWLPEGLGE